MPLNSLLGPISVPFDESWMPSLQPPGPNVEFMTWTPLLPMALLPPPAIDRRPSCGARLGGGGVPWSGLGAAAPVAVVAGGEQDPVAARGICEDAGERRGGGVQ